MIYTDGNAFSLCRNGDLSGLIHLDGDIETAGSALKAPEALLHLFEFFLRWEPIAPSSARALAETSARLCRLLRDEVTEQLALKNEVLTGLAKDWRKLLFPDASDERFADGYAQAVTFGLLMARARGIALSTGLQQVASELSKTSTLIGAALRLLTDDASNQATLKTSLGTLIRVLDAVDWTTIGKDLHSTRSRARDGGARRRSTANALRAARWLRIAVRHSGRPRCGHRHFCSWRLADPRRRGHGAHATTATHQKSVTIPANLLQAGTTYYWRVVRRRLVHGVPVRGRIDLDCGRH